MNKSAISGTGIRFFSLKRTQEPRGAAFTGTFSLSRQLNNKKTLGQATVEYVILIGFAAMIGLAFLKAFNSIIENTILGFNAVLERELIPTGYPEAGQTGQSMWEN